MSDPKVKSPSLGLLQDIYTHHLDCKDNLSVQPGEVLRLWDDQVFELHVQDKTLEGVAGAGSGFISIFKDFHLAALYRLKRIGEYLQGEYQANTTNKEFFNEFNSIFPEFIEGWYWRVIYIGYGEDLVNLEKEALKKQNLPYKTHKCKFYSKLRIYTRIDTEQGDNEVGQYTSVLSGVRGLKIENERLIPCTCNEGANWLQWWELVREYNAGNQKFIAAFDACVKRLSVMVSDKTAFEWEKAQLRNNNIYLVKYKDQTKELNNNKEKVIEIMPPELALQILNLNQSYFEIQAAWLGFTGKGSSNKASGVTKEETFLDTRIIRNIQQSNLKKLNTIAWQMRQVFEGIPEDFQFQIGGLEEEEEIEEGGDDLDFKDTKNPENKEEDA